MNTDQGSADWTSRASSSEAEAARWVAKLDAGLDEEARARFESWLQSDPRNEAAYARLSSVWDELARVAALRPVDQEVVDADLLCDEPPSLLAPKQPGWGRRIRDWRAGIRSSWPAGALVVSHWRAGIALSVLILLGAGIGLQIRMQAESFETAVGEVRQIQLQDDSTVALNTRSSLAVHFSAEQRTVELRRGEVHFRVAKDVNRPFVVRVGQTRITAVGTAFVVRVRDDALSVTVTEGRVRVSGPALLRASGNEPGQAVLLSAGHEILVSGSGASERELLPGEADRRLSWEYGVIAFEGDLLGDAIAEINRHNRCKVVISDPQLATLRLGGRFRANDCTSFLQSLQRAFDIDVVLGSGQTVFLKKR